MQSTHPPSMLASLDGEYCALQELHPGLHRLAQTARGRNAAALAWVKNILDRCRTEQRWQQARCQLKAILFLVCCAVSWELTIWLVNSDKESHADRERLGQKTPAPRPYPVHTAFMLIGFAFGLYALSLTLLSIGGVG